MTRTAFPRLTPVRREPYTVLRARENADVKVSNEHTQVAG